MFKEPFSFEGRIRRMEYALSLIIYTVIILIVMMMIIELEDAGVILFLLYIPAVWFMFAQGAKRCHDRGNQGWYQLIPFYNIIMLFGEGDAGDNGYGADPKVEASTTGESV